MAERHPRRWLILLVLCLSTLVLVVDNGVLTVAIPPLTENLHASPQDIQWIIASYILVFAGMLLTAGSLSDRYGRRKVMVIGLAAFGVASLVATYATSPEMLIAGRVLMGVGGALVMPSTLSILITVFDAQERRRAMSIWSSALMVGLIGGPVVGGVLIAKFWWGSVFLINVPIAIIAIIAALTLMPESKGPARKADPLGAILSMVGMTSVVGAIIWVPEHGIGHPLTLTAIALAVVGMTTFVVWELRTPNPMVPLALFRNRNFSGGSLSLVLLQIGNGGLVLALTQYLQFVLGFTPTQTGLALIPMAVAVILVNAVASTLGQRLGNRPLAVSGLLTKCGGFAFMTTFEPGDSFLKVAIALTIFGIGSGLAQPAAITALMGAVPHEHAGVGSALNDTVQQAGAALGVAILGSLLAGTFTGAMPQSAPEQARQSIGDALAVAAQTGDSGLAEVARSAFTSGMAFTFMAGAFGALAAAVLAFVLLRDRKPGAHARIADEQQPQKAEVLH